MYEKFPACQPIYLPTARHSAAYRSATCLQGFYPIAPVEFANHVSQKFKKINCYHFSSIVLELISSEKLIKREDLNEIWSVVIRLPFFITKTKAANTMSINFIELSNALKSISDDSTISTLVHFLCSLEQKVPCFFLSIYNEAGAKEIALKIATSGLKKEVTNQRNIIISKIKNVL